MANSKQAEKRNRQNVARRLHNRSFRSRMRTAIKRLRTAVAGNDVESAQKLLPETLKVIDSTAQKNIIHRNTAARYKSRLTKAVQGLSA